MLTACIPLIALMNGFACTDMQTTITQAEVIHMATGAGFSEEDLPLVLCIIDAESSFRPGAVSWTGSSYGLTQVHYGWWIGFILPDGTKLAPARPEWSPQVLMDAGNALHAMKFILDSSGPHAWDGYEIKCLEIWTKLKLKQLASGGTTKREIMNNGNYPKNALRSSYLSTQPRRVYMTC